MFLNLNEIKKLFIILTCVITALCFVSCSNGTDADNADNTTVYVSADNADNTTANENADNADNSTLYNTLYNRIVKETISLRTLYKTLYGERSFAGTGNSVADDSLALGLNINQPIRVANSDGSVTIEPISSEGAYEIYCSGKTTVQVRSYSIYGKSDVYAVNFVDDSPMYVSGTTKSALSSAGASLLWFDVLIPGSSFDSAPNLYVKLNNTVYNLKSLTSNANVKMYNESGAEISALVLDRWITVKVNISACNDLSSSYGNIVNLSVYSDASETIYFTDALLYKGTATYTLKEYVVTENGTGFYLSSPMTGVIGAEAYVPTSFVSGSGEGYMLYNHRDDASVKVAANGSTVIDAYYKAAIPIANTSNAGFLYPYYNSYGEYGSDTLFIKKVYSEQFAGSYFLARNGASYTLRIMGIDKAYLTDNGYSKLVFETYVPTSGFNYVVRLYTDDGQIAFSLQSVRQVSGSSICELVSSSDGNSENQVRQNNWTLVSIDLSQAQQLVGAKRINLEISVDTDVYIRNARVSAEDISTFKYYTVNHYYGDTLLGSERLYAASGSAPAVYYGAYDGYMPLPASNNTIPATVANNNSTVVNLYYTVAAPIANTDGNGYLYPYAHGTTTYGDVNYNATYHGESGTYNDSYEIKGTSTGYPVLRIMGVDKLYVVDKDYKKLTFKIYAPNDNVANNFYVKLYTDSGSSYDIRLCNQNDLNNSNVVSLYDSNGVRIYSLGTGTWTTVEVNLDKAALNFGTPRINVEISGRYSSGTDSFYIKDVKFSIGDYGSCGDAFFKEGEWILEDLDW